MQLFAIYFAFFRVYLAKTIASYDRNLFIFVSRNELETFLGNPDVYSHDGQQMILEIVEKNPQIITKCFLSSLIASLKAEEKIANIFNFVDHLRNMSLLMNMFGSEVIFFSVLYPEKKLDVSVIWTIDLNLQPSEYFIPLVQFLIEAELKYSNFLSEILLKKQNERFYRIWEALSF